MEGNKPVLGYWKIRGLAANLRYQLAYCGVDYELAEFEQAEDFSKECWLSVKETLGFDFPNLPYFIDGDFKLTETQAIHKYIAGKWKPELLGTTVQETATIDMLAGVLGDLKGGGTGPMYGRGDAE